MATDLTTAPPPPPPAPPPAAGRKASGGMAKVALRGLMDHKGRLVSTLLAVALGVAFVAGGLMLTESLLDTVLAAPGVAEAEGSVQGYARIIDTDGDPVGDPAMGPPTFGGNWQTVDALNGFTIDDGRAPESSGEVVIDRGSADDTGYQVGDQVPIQTRSASDEYELVGIARFGNADSPGGATYALWNLEEAQELVGEPGKFDSIGVVGEAGVLQDEGARSGA